MKLSVLEEKKNPNFSRNELRFEIDHGGGKTPSRKEATALVSANSGATENLISIRSIRSVFGQAKSIGHANIYKKREELEKNEPKHILKRGQKKKESPKEETPVEAPTEEAAPTESTEAPEEEKPEEAPKEETKEAEPKEESAENPEEKPEETKEEPKAKEKEGK